jgi:hypothetical protein
VVQARKLFRNQAAHFRWQNPLQVDNVTLASVWYVMAQGFRYVVEMLWKLHVDPVSSILVYLCNEFAGRMQWNPTK